MPDNELIPIELTNENIASMIYDIRGQKVMLDFDLAGIYGYTTKALNQQVNRNIDKFPSDFLFRLSKDELDSVKSQFVTSRREFFYSGQSGGTRKPPYAFTEQGVYMLMTVLRGSLATEQSIIIIRTFKQMKDLICENKTLLGTNELFKLAATVEVHTAEIKEIRNELQTVMDNFIDESTYKHFIILDGEKIEADVAYSEIYSKAKQTIIVIDDYIDVKTLQLLRAAGEGVKVTVISDNRAKNGITAEYVRDSGVKLRFIHNGGRFHDRYVILDYRTERETFYHCGASSKDAGKRITAITRLGDGEGYHTAVDEALKGREYRLE